MSNEHTARTEQRRQRSSTVKPMTTTTTTATGRIRRLRRQRAALCSVFAFSSSHNLPQHANNQTISPTIHPSIQELVYGISLRGGICETHHATDADSCLYSIEYSVSRSSDDSPSHPASKTLTHTHTYNHVFPSTQPFHRITLIPIYTYSYSIFYMCLNVLVE